MNEGLFGFPSPAPSEIWLAGQPAYAGTYSRILTSYPTVVRNIPGDMVLSMDATYGVAVTIGKPGLYYVELACYFSAQTDAGISLNATPSECAAAFTSLPLNKIVLGQLANAGNSVSVSGPVYCVPGDVLRPHTDAVSFSAGNSRHRFRVLRAALG